MGTAREVIEAATFEDLKAKYLARRREFVAHNMEVGGFPAEEVEQTATGFKVTLIATS